MSGIVGYKLDMTRITKEDKFIPVTIVEIPKIKVVNIRNEDLDGYNALVVGVLKEKSEGVLKEGKKALSSNEFVVIKEILLKDDGLEKYKVGDEITLDALEGIDEVTMIGTSKGKGFAGAMKRWNFSGGRATHGSKFHRALGSIGNRKPKRTHKGKKMHGHMGVDRITMKGTKIEVVNKEKNLIAVRGPIPGGRKSLVVFEF